jgi:aminoglycoside phosphotransferase (APT) family kinase protein
MRRRAIGETMADDTAMHGGRDAPTVGDIPLKRTGRDPDDLGRVLGQWLAPRLDGAPRRVSVSGLTAPGGTGVANETLMFDAAWTAGTHERAQGFVVRLASERPLYLDADIEVHAKTYAALADVPGVPVPRVLGYERDPELLGAPFFVMERVDGEVPADTPPWASSGFVHDASPRRRRAMWEDAVRVLASLHTVDPAKVPFLLPSGEESGLADHLRFWRRSLDSATAGRPHDGLERGWEWLLAKMPESAPTGLSWGDARFANVMFRDDRVVAIFDWDTVSMAGAEADLAWWRFMDGPASVLEGIGTPDELVVRWQEHTGRAVHDLEYYDVFTSFRLGVVMLRLFALMAANGVISPEEGAEQGRNSGPAQVLAAQLDALS